MIALLSRDVERRSDSSIYLVYVDESGTPGVKGRYYILLGLGFPLEASYIIRELGYSLLEELRGYG
ncbi:MAG: hypothetical protein F7C81_05725, partial [Desulfurococcales archaeon]|nr:hypothetical protein [Desulfurococcales archaeon]